MAIGTLFILTGDNDYVLLREKIRWKEEFERKHGRDNLLRIDGSDATVRTLLDEVSVMPFLAEKRLVMVEKIPRCTKEEANVLAKSIHPDVIVLFIDPKPDKRSAGIKELLSIAGKNAHDHPLQKGPAVARWMEEYVRERGGSLRQDARDLLLEWHGNNQGMLAGEIDKLLLTADGAPLTEDLVERICMPSDEGVIWRIGDLLYAGSKDKAILYAHRMLRRGSDPYGLWSMLLSLLKSVVAVRAALDAKVPPAALASETGVHPFALRSMQGYCKRVDVQRLRAAVMWAAAEEVRLKSGAYRSTQEEMEEIHALIDALLLRMP